MNTRKKGIVTSESKNTKSFNNNLKENCINFDVRQDNFKY